MRLKEEASIREKVRCIQKNLSTMLLALGEIAIANPVFTHGQLPLLVSIYLAISTDALSTYLRLFGKLLKALHHERSSFNYKNFI